MHKSTTAPGELAPALLAIRLSAAAFFLVWALEKVLSPADGQRVFQNFYFSSPPLEAIVAIGVVQTLVILAFAAGAFKLWTYGALLLMHAVSTLSTWARLIDPYSGPNQLFWAAVPTLAALAALFVLRRYDNLLAVERDPKAHDDRPELVA
ncbi:MAG: DoxX protein [Pseudomonadota bacterium]